MTTPDTCGCRADGAPVRNRHNAPALPEITLRSGTHPEVLARLLARLPGQRVTGDDGVIRRPLLRLTTRAADDPTIALLDGWASVADVLGFYQDRIANEGFLRTATERRSVLELARAIGYELKPGVAAGTWLSFTIEDAPEGDDSARLAAALYAGGAAAAEPRTAVIAAATRVMSVPGPDERPQTYETSDVLVARAGWNALRPRLTRPQHVDAASPTIYAAGLESELKAGGWVLIIEQVGGALQAAPKRVTRVTAENEHGRTRIDLASPPVATAQAAVNRALLDFTWPPLARVALNAGAADTLVLGRNWRERDLGAFLRMQRWNGAALTRYAGAQRRRVEPAPPPSPLDPLQPGVYALTVKAGAFGNSAPRWASLPLNQRFPASNGENAVPFGTSWDGTSEPAITKNSAGDDYLTDAGTPAAHFYLDRAAAEVQAGGLLLLERGGTLRTCRVGETVDASLAEFALSGRATGVRVQTLADAAVATSELSAFKLRSTTVHAGSRALALAELPVEDAVGAGTVEDGQLTLDGLVVGLREGQAVALSGDRADLPGVVASEVAILDDVVHSGGFTTLFFRAALRYTYARRSLTLNANVVAATHGEAVTEVLGSGDGSQEYQTFALRKPPLTHVASAAEGGVASTVRIYVNDLLWEQRPALYGEAPAARVYMVRIDDDGVAQVLFGDGRTGARPPTGSNNIVAHYRSGIGLEGQVRADAITMLQDRPLGVRGVRNPVPASGADEPERLADARTAAPGTVMTFGRIVSLADYEDFARGFAGIGKAEARELWTGSRRVVHVTVGGADGEPLDLDADLARTLHAALEKARAPLQPLHLGSHVPLLFGIAAGVVVDPSHIAARVMAAVQAAWESKFSFAARRFGQQVTAAEVVAAAHAVPGVVALDLDALHLVTDDAAAAGPTLAQRLPAQQARWGASGPEPAELLLVHGPSIRLTELAP